MKTENAKHTPQTEAHHPEAEAAHRPHHEEGGHKHHIKHTAEEWAKRLDDPGRDAWQKPNTLIALLGITRGDTVAEVGAGTGYFLAYLSKAVGENGRVLARDVEDDLVDYMRRRAGEEGLRNVTISRCPFEDPALPAKGVDRILIVNTWHHIQDRIHYGKKLAAALKPNGVLYVVDFYKTSEVGPPPEEKLSSDAVIAELESAGFNTALVTAELPEQYVIRASLNRRSPKRPLL